MRFYYLSLNRGVTTGCGVVNISTIIYPVRVDICTIWYIFYRPSVDKVVGICVQ